MSNLDKSTLEKAKYNMIEQQIRPVEIMDDSILDALKSLNRHDFVPEAYQGLAYADCQIPLSDNQSMMKPIIEAQILQALQIKNTDNCLEIGTGTGYFTACLSKLAASVHSIDKDTDIHNIASQNLANNFDNVRLENSNALDFVSSSDTYDVIVITSAVSELPDNFKNALNVGGRLFMIEGTTPVMKAKLITRTSKDNWESKILFETSINQVLN